MVETLVNILILFIGASVVLYVILGGADFGAGFMECFVPKHLKAKQREVINRAMGPVWEANHMWLIILVVILFMGFPKAFGVIVVSLHFPLVALLVGIVFRGCAFTFRHYDAIKDETSQKIYSFFFSLSSVWTSLWLGIIAASLTRGLLTKNGKDAFEIFLEPWLGVFPFVMGLFTLAIFSFLASVYMIGETKDEELKAYFIRVAKRLNISLIVIGGLLFLSSFLEKRSLIQEFLSSGFAMFCLVLATLLFIGLWIRIKKDSAWLLRVIAAAQVSLILFGWFSITWPHLILTKEGAMSFYQAAAPEPTLWQLVMALVIGSGLIFPSLIYLIKVFK